MAEMKSRRSANYSSSDTRWRAASGSDDDDSAGDDDDDATGDDDDSAVGDDDDSAEMILMDAGAYLHRA